MTNDYSTLAVCTTHIKLVGTYNDKEHRCACDPGGEGWREDEWGGYDIPALVGLCSVCVRDVVRSGSRWSWRGCETCRSVNNAIATAVSGEYDPHNQLIPLGRHSLMNGISVSPDAVLEDAGAATKELMEFFEFSVRLADWKGEEGRRLVVAGRLDDQEFVVLDEWMAAHPASQGASADAFCRFVGVDGTFGLPGLDDLRADRSAFLKRSRR